MSEHFILKNLPKSEKPYEKLEKSGAETLSDAELLAIILKSGTHEKTAVELAFELLVYKSGGLLNLHQMSLQELKSISGIGSVKAIQLKAVAELSNRIVKTIRTQHLQLSNASSVASYYMEQLRHASKENIVLCMLDTKCNFIADETISIGTVNASLVSSREVFLVAMKYKAVQIILLHNHPSGSPEPSTEDINVTKKIRSCGELLGIHLVDHIIIGDNKYYSFNEKGLIE